VEATDKRPPAQETMLGHIIGLWVSKPVYVADELGLADVLERAER